MRAVRKACVSHDAVGNAKLHCLLGKHLHVAAHCQRSNAQLVGVLAAHIKRLRSNRTRRTQHCYSFHIASPVCIFYVR